MNALSPLSFHGKKTSAKRFSVQFFPQKIVFERWEQEDNLWLYFVYFSRASPLFHGFILCLILQEKQNCGVIVFNVDNILHLTDYVPQKDKSAYSGGNCHATYMLTQPVSPDFAVSACKSWTELG